MAAEGEEEEEEEEEAGDGILRGVLGQLEEKDVCQLPSVCGICKAMFPRFFYNASTQKCERFIYGGCGGNKNNFDSEDECLSTCRFTKGSA